MLIKKLFKKDFYRYRLTSDGRFGKKGETIFGVGDNDEVLMKKINEIITVINREKK